ncbi:MAG TPA: VgrG-related protein [Acidimicrobiales bacterium]|nr:VgrG-related protein [Acidimicrobiales bacterium]
MTASRPVGEATMTVNGADLPATWYKDLVDARVEQSIQLPDRFTLRFRDPYFEHFDDAEGFPIGARVKITYRYGDQEAVVTESEVTGTSVEPGAEGRHELVVAGLGLGHRLARGSEVVTYVNQSDSQVAGQVAQRFGFRADVDQSSVQHPYLLQCGTAYQFLSERAVRCGFRWWVSEGQLHFKRQPTSGDAVTLTWGENLQRFRARCSAIEVADDVKVRGWDANQQQVVNGSAKLPADLPALGSDAQAAKQLAGAAAKSPGFHGHRFSGAIPVDDPAEAGKLAEALARRAAAQQFQARGQAIGNPHLRPGATVKIDGVGTRLNGSYLLASVEHVVGASQPYVTRFTSGGHDAGALADLLGDGRRSVASWNGEGLVVGIVTSTRDTEGLGRVKVRFPTLSDNDESAWARVAATGAGKSRGFQIPLEVNDEVLVGFEHGDLNRPIVLGGLWSGRNAIPRAGDAASDQQGNITSVWQSKSGHIVEVREGPQPANNHVLISLADGKTKLLLAGDQVTLTTPNTLSITADRGVSITTKGDITLDATNISLKAKAKVSIEAVQIEEAAKAVLKLSGAQAQVNAQATLSLEGGAMTEVKGALLKLN